MYQDTLELAVKELGVLIFLLRGDDKMRRVLILLVSILALLTLFGIFESHSGDDKGGFESAIAQDNANVDKQRQEEVNKEKKVYKSLSPEQKKSLLEYGSKLKNVMLGRNKDVIFFGKIVDQNGEPLDKVEVFAHKDYYTGEILPDFAAQKKKFNEFTNAEGVFEIDSGQTTYLSLDELKKEGYYFYNNGQVDFSYDDNSENYATAHDSISKAYIIRAWKFQAGKSARDIKEYYSSSMLNIDGSLRKINIEGLSKDVDISLGLSNGVGLQKLRKIRITIQGAGLGFIETHDKLLMSPPAGGYQHAISKVVITDIKRKVPDFLWRLYVKDGDLYKALEVHVEVSRRVASADFHARAGLDVLQPK